MKLSEPPAGPNATAAAAAQEILQVSGRAHQVAVVFGTGWDTAVQAFGEPESEMLMASLPGFSAPTVDGHAGLVRSVQIGPHASLVFRGRRHRYEFPMDNPECLDAVVHSVRTAHACGCKVIILTNAVGSLRPHLKVGTPVMISDHNDLIGNSPSPLLGPQFLDCNGIYDYGLRYLCRDIDRGLFEGVYAQVRGPHFESPAAASYLCRNGVDIVGMSIIQEAIMAHALEMRVLGLSLVTDVVGDIITHEKVQAVVQVRASALGQFLRQVIERIPPV